MEVQDGYYDSYITTEIKIADNVILIRRESAMPDTIPLITYGISIDEFYTPIVKSFFYKIADTKDYEIKVYQEYKYLNEDFTTETKYAPIG